MPVSKRRKAKRQLPPNAMPLFQARAHFRQLAQMDGATFDLDERTLVPVGPAEDSFTNAWTYAREHGLEYAEGVIWCDATGWIAHAWCVNDGKVIETTDGFGDVTTYKGWVLDRKDAETMNGGPDAEAPTRSVLETGLASGGGQWTSLAGRITRRESTPTNGPAPKGHAAKNVPLKG